MKLNTLDGYLESIRGMSIPQDAVFQTNPSLTEKVGPLGELLPYLGNTTVFLLSDEDRAFLAQLQRELYFGEARLAPSQKVLAQPLRPSTFHMTLHDLLSVPAPHFDREFSHRASQVQAQAQRIIAPWREGPPLHMKAGWLFNMVGSSIVLLLKPADSATEQRLETMYDALEALLPLGYPMTPHITLAYFRPGTHPPESAGHLRRALRCVDYTFCLTMENLAVQTFSDMNHYTTVPPRVTLNRL